MKCVAVCREPIAGFDTDHLALDGEGAATLAYGMEDGTGLALILSRSSSWAFAARSPTKRCLEYLGTWLRSSIEAQATGRSRAKATPMKRGSTATASRQPKSSAARRAEIRVCRSGWTRVRHQKHDPARGA